MSSQRIILEIKYSVSVPVIIRYMKISTSSDLFFDFILLLYSARFCCVDNSKEEDENNVVMFSVY